MSRKMKGTVWGLLMVMLFAVATPQMSVEAKTTLNSETEKNGYTGLIEVEVEDVKGDVEEPELGYNSYLASKWDGYSSDYFYNQLSASQKSLYDSTYNVCMSYLTSNVNAQSYSDQTGLSAKIIAPNDLEKADAKEVLLLFSTNNPQFYFINEYWAMGTAANGNYVQIGIYPDWVNGTTRANATNQMSAKIDSWISQINAETTKVNKEKKAHDLIIENTTYAYANYNQSSAGVFLEGKAVCAGYAEAFQLLCNGVGINTISVTSVEHEWNQVEYYGKWYNVDCTWDDGDPGCYYTYFNVSDKRINEGYHKIESAWDGFHVPTCSYDEIQPIYGGVNYALVYNFEYYCAKNPDIAAVYKNDEEGALRHFILTGMAEGRRASENFDVKSYKNAYADLRLAYGNDLTKYYLHYIRAGKNEGRTATGVTTIQNPITTYNGVNYSAVYDFNYYCAKNSDIKKAYGNDDIGAIRHFVLNGMKEGRQAKASFDVRSYRNAYADLRLAYGNDLAKYYQHYVRSGKNEGRKTTGVASIQNAITTYNGVNYSAVYDFNYYCAKNPDIKKAYGNDDIGAIRHFVLNGMKEGRQAKASFDVQSYKNANVDLRLAYGNDLTKYYQHYMRSGKNEGRKTTGVATVQNAVSSYGGVNYSSVYNYNYYCTKNPDVKRAYGNDDIAVLQHFIRSGMAEGRQASEEFNVYVYQSRYPDVKAAYGNDLKAYYLHYMRSGKNEGRSAK